MAHHPQDNQENSVSQEEDFISQDDILTEIVPDDDDPARPHPTNTSDDEDDDDDMQDEDPSSSRFPAENFNFEQAFSAHQQSVFTIAGHPSPNAPMAVSGGEDDLGYIWDITDGQVIVKLTGHSDSVTAAAWSADGEMVATGGMDGNVRIWRRVGTGEDWSKWEFLTELQGPDEVMFLRWHPKGNVLLAGSNDGTLWLWQLPAGNTMQVFAGHMGPVQCGDFTPDGKRIVSADGEGNLCYWDPRNAAPIFKLSADRDARFDVEGITSLGVNPSSTLVVVGGGNGGVRVVSLTKGGEILASLSGHKEGESVESVAFVEIGGSAGGGPGGPGVVVTGSTDGKALIWDLGTMRLRGTLEHEDAVTTILPLPSPRSHIVVSASSDKLIKVWDSRTGRMLRELKGHSGPVLAASLGLNGDVILSAGDDGHCLVFTTEQTDETGMTVAP